MYPVLTRRGAGSHLAALELNDYLVPDYLCHSSQCPPDEEAFAVYEVNGPLVQASLVFLARRDRTIVVHCLKSSRVRPNSLATVPASRKRPWCQGTRQ